MTEEQGGGWAAPAGGPSGPRASFGQRFAGWLIDVLIVLPISIVIAIATPQALGQLIQILFGLGYYVFFEGSPSGQTPGKRALSIRVVDARTGGRIDPTRAFLRYIGRIISGLAIGIGYLWMLWDREKQTWHDKIATTYVVPTSSAPVDRWPGY